MPRIAKSLDVLRSQINARFPNRSKLSDGWIGDTAHASRGSDHNPNSAGVVTALDITHDPAHGVDTWKLAEVLRQNKDPRIKYVISNGLIFSSAVSPWQWRPYTGANKHAHHVHVSVTGKPELYDLESSWNLQGWSIPVATPPVVKPPAGVTDAMRRRMGKAIVDFEARRVNGKLAVYHPPANDGGGAYEVAGINARFHPRQAARLKRLIEQGRADQAEREAIDYLLDYTTAAAGWTTDAGAEFYLRDSIFNRGPKGAARILQRAVMAKDDGEVGPTTRAAIEKYTPEDLLAKLRWARESYERNVVGYRANFWKGLTSRWDKALVKARAFQKEQGEIPAIVRNTIKIGVPGAAVTWSLWGLIAAHPVASALIAASAIAVAIAAWRAIRSRRAKSSDEPLAPVPAIIES